MSSKPIRCPHCGKRYTDSADQVLEQVEAIAEVALALLEIGQIDLAKELLRSLVSQEGGYDPPPRFIERGVIQDDLGTSEKTAVESRESGGRPGHDGKLPEREHDR